MKLLFAFLASWLAAGSSAAAEELTADAGDDRSIRLVCIDPGTGMNVAMRAGLLAHDGAGEIALTAAHGLRGRTQCRLSAGGLDIPVEAMRRGAGVGPEADWALVRTRRRLDGGLPRYRLAQVTGDRFEARMVASRALQPRCRVSPPPGALRLEAPVVVHDCRVLPGRSGAPLIAARNGERYVVGLTLGYLTSPDEAFNNVAFARLVDGAIADALIDLSR